MADRQDIASPLPKMAGIEWDGKIWVAEADCRAAVNAALKLKHGRVELLEQALRTATDVLANMSDFWAYGMAKAEGAEADEHEVRTVEMLGKSARAAVDTARALLAEHQSSEPQRHGS
jgi:hypothetical protein